MLANTRVYTNTKARSINAPFANFLSNAFKNVSSDSRFLRLSCSFFSSCSTALTASVHTLKSLEAFTFGRNSHNRAAEPGPYINIQENNPGDSDSKQSKPENLYCQTSTSCQDESATPAHQSSNASSEITRDIDPIRQMGQGLLDHSLSFIQELSNDDTQNLQTRVAAARKALEPAVQPDIGTECSEVFSSALQPSHNRTFKPFENITNKQRNLTNQSI